MTKDEIKRLQHEMNVFAKKRLHGLGNILEDGRLGQSTNGRIRTCKYYLGYLKPINGEINKAFRERLYHPNSVKYSTLKRVRRGQERRVKQRKLSKKNHKVARKTQGVGTFDGIPVANVAIPILSWCRNNGWRGGLNSGWRSRAYSQSLCFRMCGRPSCPGLCAGVNTNHVGTTPQQFAVDVSDYYKFRQVVARCPEKPRIFNNLPRDLVHFSPSGN